VIILPILHLGIFLGILLVPSAFEIGDFFADFLVYEYLVVFEFLLDVDLEMDHVVENSFNLCVQLFSDMGCSNGEFFEPVYR
jgi:hypothetical protein